MSTNSRDELPYNFPLELIDEIISWNENDFSFLYSVSLVSKTWRAAALRYLFKLASFLCKHDFVRWRQIGASLPHVAQYVRTVMVDLGTLRTLRHRAKSLPTGFIARTYDLSNDSALLTSALDFTFPKDSEFDVIIPIMRNAKKLIWTTPSAEDGFDPTAANVTRFLQSFPNITHLYYLSLNLFRPEVQAHFMSFFHNLRKCSFTSWKSTQSEHVYVFSGHPRIDVSKLEKIWCEECEPGSLDWLVDDVLHYSPSRIRKIGWEYGDPPFSPNNFARLLLMAHETLQELCFRPPWSTDVDMEDYEAPPFNLTILPVLRILSFKVLHISEEGLSIMLWLESIFAVFPSCPCLQRLEFIFHVTESRDIDDLFASRLLDWNSLLEVRFPSLKVIEFEMLMTLSDDFDAAERKRVETIVRQSTEMVNCDKFVMRWT